MAHIRGPEHHRTGKVPRSAFKKGQSGNPKGSSQRSRELAAIRRLTIEELAEVATLLLNGQMREVLALKKDVRGQVIKVWLASLIERSVRRGDAQTFDLLMDRIIGKSSVVPYTRAMRESEEDGGEAMQL